MREILNTLIKLNLAKGPGNLAAKWGLKLTEVEELVTEYIIKWDGV